MSSVTDLSLVFTNHVFQVSVVPFLSLGIGIDDMFIFIYTLVSTGYDARYIDESRTSFVFVGEE